METSENLTTFGKNLTAEQFIDYLNTLIEHPERQSQLAYVLVGLNPVVFSQALQKILPPQLKILEKESLLEPLQYHLAQISHEGETLCKHLHEEVLAFEITTTSLLVESLTLEGMHELFEKIEWMKENILLYLPRIDNALTLIWQTDRIDLIEKLSALKESLLYLIIQVIGRQKSAQETPTGLYKFLDETLSAIYDTTLHDDDAAVEGLTRLSIWFIEDYREIGIIPSIENEEFKDKHLLHHHVQKQLERLNIGTVKALKQARIYSKPLLKTYIDQHLYLL